ncbi:hypothetical protein H0H87_009085 [Tephrocybe sp. NHM501043]|nr:hypothetical protein H0H87_009085 [Tephrocybe sp. NHM501043]
MTAALDLYISILSIDSQLSYRLLVLVGIRTFVYGILAFGDPSFLNAIRELKRGLSTLTFRFATVTTSSQDKISILVDVRPKEAVQDGTGDTRAITETERREIRTLDRQL